MNCCYGDNILVAVKITALFFLTALAEIVGGYLPWLVLKQGKTLSRLFPAAISLILFSWLLTLHPNAAGRTYAAYVGVYIAGAAFLASICRRNRFNYMGFYWCSCCSYRNGYNLISANC